MRDFHQPGRSAVFAENGICATSHPLAAKVAVQIMEAGGNAVDAAIAGAMVLNVCEPHMTGIFGDCFALVAPEGGEVVALNGSGAAPAGYDAARLRAEGLSAVPADHPATITLPGAIDAFCRLSKDHGRIGLKATLAPAIHYAEAGVPVAPRVALDWALAEARLKAAPTAATAKHFLLNSAAPRAGQVFRAPGLAEVLRRVAMDGRAGFYEGEVAEDFTASLKAIGAPHTLEDFAGVTTEYATPISGHYGKHELVEHPPNGQGATAILLANILKRFDQAWMDPNGAERVHLEAEATKLAYDARNRFIAEPGHGGAERLLDDGLAERLAGLIDMNRAMGDPEPLTEEVHRDTVYITVVDRDRLAVSLIFSIFHGFGSAMASDRFGILFHNRGAGFSLREGHPNEGAPGKRPMHTIIPGLLRQEGRAVMPFGVMGGAYQATGHLHFLSNMDDFGMDAQSAIDAPRAFAENGELRLEKGYADGVARALADKGHNVVRPDTPIGGAQAIRIDRELGVLEGASDPRKDGIALGY